ncbi:MAG TPA: 3-oxoacyl-ACP synthase [Bacteroidia bacterium]|jgi:hypothetical protein|nr:3-oxoacyl-ACP synthase [Bacteroidia bacterium]
MSQLTISLKKGLHEQCLQYIQNCINNVQLALADAIQSGNSESKSSAGDKHETTRSLLQLEQEKHTKQLSDLMSSKEKLLRIDPFLHSEVISTGSIAMTTAGNFYIAIAAGKLVADENTYFAISPNSPIAVKLMGAKVKDRVHFKDITYDIEAVF